MQKIISFQFLSVVVFFIISLFYSCSKSGGGGAAPDPCAGITISVTGTTTNPSAIGSTTGSIAASATGSTGITYSINGGNFQTSGTFTGLVAGTYTVIAKNSKGCSGSAVFTLNDPPDPCLGVTINIAATVTNPTAGNTNGSIIAVASGSSGFMYSLNGGVFQASGTFNNLGDGSFVITARDVNNCTGTKTFTLATPNPCSGVTIVVTGTTTNPSSAVSNDGNILVSASGSSGFMYSLNGGVFQAGSTFNNLGVGSYTVTARDLNNCTGSGTFILTVPNPCTGVVIAVNANVTGNSPCEPANGMLSLSANGGTSPYQYNLNGGLYQSSNVFTNLAAGNFTIFAKDANNCIGSSSVVISNLVAGPLFSAVRIVLQNNCVSCHNNTQSEGGMNWTVDCNIITFKDRIQSRAVDANPSSMPPTGLLPASERQKITDWINAGGRYTN